MCPAPAPVPIPRLSVIVPVHNVEAYLAACLDSLADQELRAAEFLLVDDGSTDASARIAAEYQARDARFRLIHQKNGGLGSARNTGVRHMSEHSEYLAFLDSDDFVPPYAYRAMVAALDESGSDFATGNVHHVHAARTWQTPMFRMLAARSRRRTHISEFPELVADRTACNKVYRRSFWSRHGFTFPEGVLYEDIPVTLPAHYLARAVDVLSEPVYYWRVRDSGAALSITHRRTEPGACRDRVNAVLAVSRFLAARHGPRWAGHKRHYDRSALLMDLKTFLQVLPDGDTAYHREFLRYANRFLDRTDPRILQELPLDLRVQWSLVRRRALPELLATLTADRWDAPVEVRGRWRRHAHFPEQGQRTRAPRSARRLRRQDLRLHAPVRELAWHDGKLWISGDAWVTRLDAPSRLSHAKVVQLRKLGAQRRIVLPVRNRFRPERTAESGDHGHCYDWAGYDLAIDPERLKAYGEWEEGTWALGIGVLAPGVVRLGSLTVPSAGHPAAHPPYHWVSDELRVVPFAENRRLLLRIEKVHALITGRARYGERLELRGELRAPLASGERPALRLTALDNGEIRDHPVETTGRAAAPWAGAAPGADAGATRGTGFAARVPLHGLLPGTGPGREERGWRISLVAVRADGTVRHFATVLREGLPDAEFTLPAALRQQDRPAELAVVSGHDGCPKLWVRPAQAVIVAADWTPDGRLRLSGRTSIPAPAGGAELVLRAASRPEERVVPLTRFTGGVFEAEFTPSAVESPAGPLPLRTGGWNLLLRLPGTGREIGCRIDRPAVPGVSRPADSGGRRYRLTVRAGDTPQLHCDSELSPGERGNYHQHRLLREVYRPLRAEPLRDTVLYLSYNGKQCSDSPRAIHEELLRRDLRLRHLWVIRDGQAPLPPGAHAVRLWSREWFEALATSRYIVTNAHLPQWLERRTGQVIVQTWHGTMLKKIGHDIERPQFDRGYHDRIRRDVRNWSLLVSANRFSTPILRRAFRYEGEIIEAGYPRNDALYGPDREQRAERIRERLGLPPGRKAVLYAPTWRDDLAGEHGDYPLDLRLDLAAAERELARDHVLLVRGHPHVADRVPGAGGGFVWDVSQYPELADLLLAADILVTDYSSVMFDFAHTGRPMLFFTYDLEHYRDTLRGFCFDFAREAPGPLLRTSDELITAVRDIGRVAAEHRGAYDRFVDRFCDLDDGAAAGRVADRMLSLARPAPEPSAGPERTAAGAPTVPLSPRGGGPGDEPARKAGR